MVEKRKAESQSVDLSVKVAKGVEPESVVISSFFNGLELPDSTDFEIYKNKKNDLILHGESNSLEYEGIKSNDEPQQYAIAVYDPSNKVVELIPAAMISSRVTSKSKRSSKGPKVKQVNVRNNIQRNLLGEAFGTKRAKKAIADMERNRIDSGKLESTQIDIIDSIKVNTEQLPSRKELEEKMNEDRPVPEYFADATSVSDVYPLESMIPNREWNFLRVDGIMNETDPKVRLDLLCYSNSRYLMKKLSSITPETSNRKQKLQILYYISVLMGVYANRRAHSKEKLVEKLNSPPGIVVDSVLDRFTVSKASQFGKSKDRSFTIDPAKEDKLLCYILALILHMEEFHVDITPLAQELSLKPSRLNMLFRALGCVIKNASAAEAEALSIPKSQAASYKIAVLKVPFKIPETAKRVRRN